MQVLYKNLRKVRRNQRENKKLNIEPMHDLIMFLDKINRLIKNKDFDNAWKVANKGLIDIDGENKYLMYYQMAIILSKEKKWADALEKMGFVIYYLKRVGGTTHNNFIIRLLKKVNKEKEVDVYIKLAVTNPPREFRHKLHEFLKRMKDN